MHNKTKEIQIKWPNLCLKYSRILGLQYAFWCPRISRNNITLTNNEALIIIYIIC